jgi:hypothetical protein
MFVCNIRLAAKRVSCVRCFRVNFVANASCLPLRLSSLLEQRRYTSVPSEPHVPVIGLNSEPRRTNENAEDMGDSGIDVGDSVYAVWGDDGLYYSGTVCEVLKETGEYRVEFISVPDGDNLQKVIQAKDVVKDSEDSVTSFVVNNFIISDKEKASIPPENWAYASQMAWIALAKATLLTLCCFILTVTVIYVIWVKNDADWHVRLGCWARTKLGLPAKNPNRITVAISWSELLIMFRDGEPPERVRLEMERLAAEQNVKETGSAE